MKKSLVAFLAATALIPVAHAQQTAAPSTFNDIPAKFDPPAQPSDFIKREVMIPMRDGVKLYTVIVIPKGAKNAPILFTRTPYNAAGRVKRTESTTMISALPEGDEVFVRDGYIRVFQDIRGKYKSEGEYVITRPPVGPLNPTKVDHTTDAWDSIDWMVKNTPNRTARSACSARAMRASPW
jgi:predicted acyl esterase